MTEAETTDPVVFRFPVLVGDIGGTNARFALITDSHGEPKFFDSVQTSDYDTIEDAIQGAVLDKTSLLPQTAILAVAGPVDGNEIPLTNCDWVVNAKNLIAQFRLSEVIVLNDYEAQAMSLSALKEDDIAPLTERKVDPVGPKVILGPGTGLGVAALVNVRGVWMPIPGEGGHIDLAPVTKRDFEYWPHLETIEGRVSAEQIICGRGIVNLYNAICTADGIEPKFKTPSLISSAALERTDKAARETMELFTQHLGRVAGNLALIFMASGGVYLTGGISQKVIEMLREGDLIEAFDDKAPHGNILKEIAVNVVLHPLAPVLGLVAFAQAPARFGMKTTHRRWLGDV